jgi:peroxiredoxin
LAAVRSAGGNIFGTSAEGNKETVNFMNELQSQLELISDPSASLGLRFHLNILKTTHASHPLQLITKPALLAIRRKYVNQPLNIVNRNVK